MWRRSLDLLLFLVKVVWGLNSPACGVRWLRSGETRCWGVHGYTMDRTGSSQVTTVVCEIQPCAAWESSPPVRSLEAHRGSERTHPSHPEAGSLVSIQNGGGRGSRGAGRGLYSQCCSSVLQGRHACEPGSQGSAHARAWGWTVLLSILRLGPPHPRDLPDERGQRIHVPVLCRDCLLVGGATPLVSKA